MLTPLRVCVFTAGKRNVMKKYSALHNYCGFILRAARGPRFDENQSARFDIPARE